MSLIGQDALDELAEFSASSPMGCFVEVGVYKGGSALYLDEIAKKQGRELYLYDTFEGIPFKAEIDSHKVGDFSDTSYEAVRSLLRGAHVIKGVFPASIVKMPPIGFVHVDCDQYQSVKDCCLVLPPLMVRGGLMLFDDYNCLIGASRAVEECFKGIILTRNNKALVRVNGLED